MTNQFKILMTSVAACALASCGADDVASPGEGVIVVPAPAPAPSPSPTPTPTPTPTGGPADSCPTGTANVGTIEVGGSGSGDERRVCQISGTITSDTFIPNNAGTIYSLSGKVQVGVDAGGDANNPVGNTAVLTIEEGVTIFGASGADFLAVNRGSQLVVDGKADAPVVMTSRANVVGDAVESSTGDWGGVVILGRAPIGDCLSGTPAAPATCESPVEGTSGSLYGGNANNDSSGRIQYLQVRYAGFKVDLDNELNGITLAGVGAGTIFDHIQVHNNSDDGIEWFGGSVNNYNLVLTGNEDEAIDYDSGYNGLTQFVIIDNSSGRGDKLIEIDSSDKPFDNTPATNVEIVNMTAFTTEADKVINARAGTDLSIYNSAIVTGGGFCIDIDDSETLANMTDEEATPFHSVYLDCGNPAWDDGNGGISAGQIAALFDANSNVNYSNTLIDNLINGSTEIAATAETDYSALSNSGDVTTADYIGAVEDGSDTWWQGWTCGLPGEASCLDIPAAG